MCVVLGVFAWVVKCGLMILFSISVNRVLYGNRHASEVIISASFQIPQKKIERGSVTHVFCELFCPCVLATSYSVVWVTVWVLSVAVISPVKGIPLPVAVA